MICPFPIDVILGHCGRPGDGFQFDQWSFSLFFVLVQVDLGVSVCVFLVFEGEIVHGVILIKSTTFHALYDSLGIDMVLPIQDLNDSIFNDQILISEIDEMHLRGLVSQAEFACSQFPQSDPMFRLYKNGRE